MSMCLSNTILF